MTAPADALAPLRDFVVAMTALVESTQHEPTLVARGRTLLRTLVSSDTWLPDEFAQASPGSYRQYLLHCDPKERFSVVSFVWGPGARTPVHDHTVWGLVGMMRGAESCHEYERRGDTVVSRQVEHTFRPGMVEAVSPTIGDWHVVANALPDQASISIHVYGGNIGAISRHRLDERGAIQPFVSGYSSAVVPNLWDRSAQVRAQVGA